MSTQFTNSVTHTYLSATPRAWNNLTTNRVEWVQGEAGLGSHVSARVTNYVTAGATAYITFESAGVFSGTNYDITNTMTGTWWQPSMNMTGMCNLGYNFVQPMEYVTSGTVTNVSITLAGMIEG